jgi:hypothetical protein
MGAPNRGPKVPAEGGGTKTKSKGKSTKSKKNAKRGGGDSLASTLLLVGAGVALVPLIRRVREWVDARRGNDNSKSSDAGSAFTFGKKGKKGKGKKAAKGERATADAPMRKPPGAAAAAARGSNASMPRSGKMQSNKKNKARKAERKEERQAEKTKDAHKAGQLPPSRGGTTVIREGNNVPKDEDIIGGEAGKTFTTTSHVKVPTWYAKVREERGND